MSWMYPRTVTVVRSAAPTSVGAIGYQGRQTATEVPVIPTPVPANIQEHKSAANPLADLPSDATGRGDWRIFIPLQYSPLGLILKNDIVVDDQGVRYNVTLPYWNGFGCALVCETLKN